MPKVLTRCPVCEHTLHVSEVTCARCHTRIHGAFNSCRFCRLAPEYLAFIETFLRCEGNISRVEKELSLSYPTVRNKLSAALSALGFGEETEAPESAPSPEYETRRRAVLEAVARGEYNAAQAAEALRGISGDNENG